MARKSGWQEFTENFNGVYGAFTKAAQGIETARVMNDEKFTAEGKGGAGLEGSSLEAARYRALSDIQAKYGDVKGALESRNSYQSLRNSTRENEIGDATQDEVTFQRGLGASNEVRARTNASNASAASSYASARNSDSLVTDRNATRPGRLEQIALTNTGLGLTNDGRGTKNAADALALQLQEEAYQADLEVRKQAAIQAAANVEATRAGTGLNEAQTNQIETLIPGKVAAQLADLGLKTAQTDRIEELLSGEKALQGQQLRSAIAQMGLTEANANKIYAMLPGDLQKQRDDSAASQAATEQVVVETDNLKATSPTTNALKIAEANLGINIAESALATATLEDKILSDVMSAGYKTAAEADAAVIEQIRASNMPLERQRELISTIQKIGLEKLGTDGAAFTQEGMNALAKGLDAGIEWYDTVDNNDTLAIDRSEPGIVRVMRTVGDSVTELFSATGPNAESEIMATLGVQISKPSAALSVAAEVANLAGTNAATAKDQSQTRLIDAQVFTEMMQTNSINAKDALVEAQTDLVREQIAASKNGLGGSQQIAEQGLAALMRAPEFLYMGGEENGLELQQAAIDQYRRTMGMQPDGPTQAELDAMSPEERALFK
jgi:hypothetical protein